MAGYAPHAGNTAMSRRGGWRSCAFLSLWADYTAATGLIGLAAIFILPWVIG